MTVSISELISPVCSIAALVGNGGTEARANNRENEKIFLRIDLDEVIEKMVAI